VPVVETSRLTKDFGPVRALDAVSLEIETGRVGLLGPNGAGKSTLIKCLLGLVKPTAGAGAVLGLDVASNPLAVRQRVGYLPEVDCHIPGLSAAEFVAYAGELAGMPSKDARKRAHEVLDYVGLAEERYRLVDTYSTGMKQKVKLAQAVVHDPELLFLDEPTNGLDPAGRANMLDLVRDLGKSHGISILYSSHLLGDVEAVCEEVLILRQGKVLSRGNIEALKEGRREGFEVRLKGNEEGFLQRLQEAGLSVKETAPGRVRVLPSDTGEEAPWKPVFEAARETGIQLRSFRPVQSTLEEVFIEALEGEGARGMVHGKST